VIPKISALPCLVILLAAPFTGRAQTDSPLLVRRYRPGERILYRIAATNEEKGAVTHYEAQADGEVKRDSAGEFFELFAWSNLKVGDDQVFLAPASVKFRERLSLSPSSRPAIPDVRRIDPALVGPVVDLLTFYADLQVALREPGLVLAGDHVYVNDGTPNSWADGKRVILGEDAIDFDITVADVGQNDSVVTLLLRHLPPARPAVLLKAPWMKVPVGESSNNWVQVSKRDGGGYLAAVGMETFVASIRLRAGDGGILGATLDNRVDVLERECRDTSFTICGDPRRYLIRRRVEIH
jgi:hypothetical protein